MLEVVFFMFLAGCSDDMSECSELAGPVTPFASAEACVDALATVTAGVRSDWPITHGICRPSAGDRVAARPDWLPPPLLG
jgi:hypothetical protein